MTNKFKAIHEEAQVKLATDFENWHFGLRFEKKPTLIMKGVLESLLQLETTYVVKSPSFKIKCFHKIHKSSTLNGAYDMEPIEIS